MRLIDADHLKSILQEYVKREKSYVELGEFPTKLIASCMISGLEEAIAQIDSEPSAQPETEKYEYHYDHTDCIWYRPEARNRCPVTCAQYRDGWNDAMNYIFRDGKGYKPYRRDKQYGE